MGYKCFEGGNGSLNSAHLPPIYFKCKHTIYSVSHFVTITALI